MSDDKGRPNISISQSANNSENVTQIGYQEGNVTIDNSRTDSSVHISGGVNVDGVANIGSGTMNVSGDIVGRDKIIGAPANASPEIEDLYAKLDARFNALIAAQQDEFQKQVVEQAIAKVREEVEKGREAEENVNQVDLYNALNTVKQNSLGTDVVEVIDTIITKGPAAGIATVVQKIWDKVKGQAQG